jgi:hypothetical protein
MVKTYVNYTYQGESKAHFHKVLTLASGAQQAL